MHILITGGCGYIGDASVDYLLKNNHTVTVVDNLMYGGAYMRQHKNLKFIRADITDTKFFDNIIPHCDAVLHLAAIVGDGACAVNPERTVEVNQKATGEIAALCTKYDKRLVFASTCSVYGAARTLLTEDSPTNPLSLYARTKLNAEELVKLVPEHYIFRLGTLFGLSTEHARLRCDLVANILTYKAMTGQKLTVFGGDQWRPLLHVRDAGELMARACVRQVRDVDKNDKYGTYILARQNMRIIDLAYTILAVCDLSPQSLEVSPMQFEDQRNYKVSPDRRGKFWLTRFPLSEGLFEMATLVCEGRIANLWDPRHHNARYVSNNG